MFVLKAVFSRWRLALRVMAHIITMYPIAYAYGVAVLCFVLHYNDVIMSTIASQIISLTIVFSVYSDTDQRKYQSSASLAFVRVIHRRPVNSLHKWQWRGKCFHLMTTSWLISNPNGFTWSIYLYHAEFIQWQCRMKLIKTDMGKSNRYETTKI